jgi:hypothetical protein
MKSQTTMIVFFLINISVAFFLGYIRGYEESARFANNIYGFALMRCDATNQRAMEVVAETDSTLISWIKGIGRSTEEENSRAR